MDVNLVIEEDKLSKSQKGRTQLERKLSQENWGRWRIFTLRKHVPSIIKISALAKGCNEGLCLFDKQCAFNFDFTDPMR